MTREPVGRGLEAAAAAALELVGDGATLGLGTGRAASCFIALLGARVGQGFKVSGVATSSESARAATDAGITLVDLGEELLRERLHEAGQNEYRDRERGRDIDEHQSDK